MGYKTGATSSTKDRVLLDAGVVFIQATESSEEVKIGVTRGGCTFDQGVALRDVEYDNSRGATKGFVTKDKGNAILTGTALELTKENLSFFMPGFKIDGNTIVDAGQIKDTDYLYKVIWRGYRKEDCSQMIEIEITDALQTQDIGIPFADNDEATIPFTFMGHYDLDATEDSEGFYPEAYKIIETE